MKLRLLLILVVLLALPVGLIAMLREVKSKMDSTAHPKVIVIGFDGFDPRLCTRLMDAGEMPNLARLRAAGGFKPLGTTIPPQSPVAWSSFITGLDPGGHGIFDFIHRDPNEPFEKSLYYSAALTHPGKGAWEVGEHRIPLTFWPFNDEAPHTELRRRGTPFWDHLDAAGIPHWMYCIPANYPPSASQHGYQRSLSGMGVVDLLGSYGTYQYFSRRLVRERDGEGGISRRLRFKDDLATATLRGPENAFLKQATPVEIPFTVHRDKAQRAARIDIQGKTILLKEGEWSDWQQLAFSLSMPPFLPDESISGIVRFFLMETEPDFKLYVTPINIDPSDPGAFQISEPASFVQDMARELGLFYTSGFQEDYNALKQGTFTDAQYLQQANLVLEQRFQMLDYALAHYTSGLLYFYFSSTDLQAHMFWWDSDQPHPTRSPEDARTYMTVIEDLYRRMDQLMGDILARYGDDATVVLISDHGFANFRREFNLDTWLRDNGYIQPPDCVTLSPMPGEVSVDWSRTRAYGIGINSLYVNLAGREPAGCVPAAEKDALLEELRTKLLAVRDPADGAPVIKEVYRADEVYHGPYVKDAPDLILGYHRDYRGSWSGTLGRMDEEVIQDNHNAWSADHCIAADEVPGVVFSNKAIRHPNPALIDLAPTILTACGVKPPAGLPGRDIFAPPAAGERAKE